MNKALSGTKVLDVSRVLAGPFCAMLLADLGADVIKVEVPRRGDDSRQFGPFRNGESGYYMTFNRGKRSVTLDLRKPEGQAVFKDLARTADVVVENFAVGTMDKWGIGYDDLKTINPRIVFGSITGFGQYGPNSQRKAFDPIAQAMGGLMSVTGPEGGTPVRVGIALADISAAQFLTNGILAALIQRGRTGEGQRIDVSMQDSIVGILENSIIRHTFSGEIPSPLGSRHPTITPYDVFRTRDGQIFICGANDASWQRLCKVMGRPELANEKRFQSNQDRTCHVFELKELIEDWTKGCSQEEVLTALEASEVPCAAIMGIDAVVSDPHLKARNMFVEVNHPTAGKVLITGMPIKMSASSDIIGTPPVLGEHTETVLKELEYSEERIAKLRATGTI
jgi:crotonobetainyl-CoA:carnitine CoA-transferase CaiB-like acyl-CoA transferase